MPKASEVPVLTEQEVRDIEQPRRSARERALRIAESMSEAEDAALTAAAQADPDNPPISTEQFARMRPAHEVRPRLVAAQIRNKGGRPKSAAPKQMVTLRVPPEVLEAYRATGRGWQTRMVETLSREVGRRPAAPSRGEVKPLKKQARSSAAKQPRTKDGNP